MAAPFPGSLHLPPPDIAAATLLPYLLLMLFPLILGIESSCDETAAAVIRGDMNGIDVLSSTVATQDDAHRPFGGVVPEIAAREHMGAIARVTQAAVAEAGVAWSDIDAVAATSGPGLIGGVITGLLAAKGLAVSLGKPLIAVNHLEGHALSVRLSDSCPFPYLLLLVSGGHTQLLEVTGVGAYRRLGSTLDDAAGEAFDKSAKVMGLGFPGGPNVERWAERGDPTAFSLPRPLRGQPGADFSFAGLKTAVARAWEASDRSDTARADLSASFQAAVCEVISDRVGNAIGLYRGDGKRLVVAGGVAANTAIRAALDQLARKHGFQLIAPPLRYCTDNAAMIALAGLERFRLGRTDPLDARARPRWPLDSAAAQSAPASGSGKKGPKS